MHPLTLLIASQVPAMAQASTLTLRASSLVDVCTDSYVQAALPGGLLARGIDLTSSKVTATAVYNSSQSSGGSGLSTSGGSESNYPYCNITFSFSHTGRDDTVQVIYALPQPSDFKSRFYVAGGGGYSLSSSATGGLQYGAASGATSAGYDEVVLYGNGSINWDATYAFGYHALGEMAILGKALTRNFYGNSTSKLYTYFEGCSDGGREGMSQVQRWGEEYDGVIAGAPAFRYAQQQVNHVFSSLVEHTLDYYPPPCALAKIVNATIAACDPLDGRTDGVISRTDLCMLNFNLTSIIGEPYYCAAQSSTSLGFGFSSSGGPPTKRQVGGGAAGSSTSYQPAQNGTVNSQDVAVAQTIYAGLHDSSGQRAYLSWQIGSEFGDAGTVWNNATNAWELSIPSTGGEFVTKFVQLLNVSNLANLDNITYDTAVEWMNTAYWRYLDSLQTTIPDLTPFQQSGGKLLHYHGESDPSVPSASSVHYWQSVKSIMYGNTSTSNSNPDALSDWYQLYLVPGAAHCGTNSLQPDGPYPQNNMQVMIDWVENGVKPERLNATVSVGADKGQTQMLCQWPTRPLWTGNGTDEFNCVTDEAGLETWTYEFPAFKVPIY